MFIDILKEENKLSKLIKISNDDYTIVEMDEMEEQALRTAIDAYKKRELKRPLEQHEVINMMIKAQVNAVAIDDQMSLRMKQYYPKFEELEDNKNYPKGFKFTYEEELWKTRQEPTMVQHIYPPSIDTAALYERIDEEHLGTFDDPISYDSTMQVYKDLYYIWEEVLYKCIRDSGQPLFVTPDTLLNNYFEVA